MTYNKPTCAGALIVQAQALYALGNFEHALVWKSNLYPAALDNLWQKMETFWIVSCTGVLPQSKPAGGTANVREGRDSGDGRAINIALKSFVKQLKFCHNFKKEKRLKFS